MASKTCEADLQLLPMCGADCIYLSQRDLPLKRTSCGSTRLAICLWTDRLFNQHESIWICGCAIIGAEKAAPIGLLPQCLFHMVLLVRIYLTCRLLISVAHLVKQICHSCVERLQYVKGDIVFSPGEAQRSTDVLLEGTKHGAHIPSKNRVDCKWP